MHPPHGNTNLSTCYVESKFDWINHVKHLLDLFTKFLCSASQQKLFWHGIVLVLYPKQHYISCLVLTLDLKDHCGVHITVCWSQRRMRTSNSCVLFWSRFRVLDFFFPIFEWMDGFLVLFIVQISWDQPSQAETKSFFSVLKLQHSIEVQFCSNGNLKGRPNFGDLRGECWPNSGVYWSQ